MSDRFYKFSWAFIGDIEQGRPNLGNTTRIEVYRLFQYTLRDILEEDYGAETCDRIFYKSGYLAGKHFCLQFVKKTDTFSEYFSQVQQILEALKIGILRMEQSNLEDLHFTLTVAEDLDCSGLPDVQHLVCTYDEGFLAAIFDSFSDVSFEVKEIDCWCTGDRTCRFEIRPKQAPAL